MEDSLNTISFQQLLDLSAKTGNVGQTFKRQFTAFPIDTKDNKFSHFFKYPTRLNALLIIICQETEEETHIHCDTHDCVLKGSSIFHCKPGSIIQSSIPGSCKGWGIICEPGFAQELNLSSQRLLPHLSQLQQEILLEITPEQACELSQIVKQIYNFITKTDALFYEEVVKSSIAVLGYELMNLFASNLEQEDTSSLNISRDENYFKQFMILLNEHHIKERSVMFYADKMHLSPKYLSAVVKNVSGKTPSHWIDEIVIMEAKNILKYSGMNIQEVAYYLNFPNQSFFGKYFKQRTGMTPSSYRES